ncbi:hypothetical protein QN366_04975 [Pseudomonas sp. CCC3.2]|uniref:hypothetical protein n=1 Tax=unclassified Pseudomonas TaxID=196821 RepID=UPI002AB57782|nr:MULTISPECIES: hypothetical protein [unclassified Pseudomonas]MDY7559933.1 hypothetical protein [Pseudomonas sp. AB6]MEB0179427.1 hypothetical protein [Pseudomonas sp. CCC3.2]MEB0210493.1 hypothetical protein [Pseudomonas sp. AB6]
MARSRNIKPGFFSNEHLAEVDFATRLLFIGLWTEADREGRLEDRPRRLKMALFPADNLDIDSMLFSLHDLGFIDRYSVDGANYIQIVNWAKHQNPHLKETKSTIPERSEIEPCPVKEGASTMQAPDENSSIPADSLSLDSLSSDSGFLIPSSGIQDQKPLPVAKAPAASNVKVLKPKAEKHKTDAQLANAATWNAYSNAYYDRYGAEPVRNAKVNGQVAQLVSRLGAAEAPHVAAFYVAINDSFYLRSSHEFGLLVARAEGIRTQWVTGRQVNSVTARQMENTQANMSAAEEAKAMIMSGGTQNAFLRR